MIDTITLMTKRALIEPDNNLVINYRSTKNRHVTLNYTDGKSDINIDHVYYNHKNVYEIDFSFDNVYLKFSPGKILSEYSINYPVITTVEDFTNVLGIVWETTLSDGIVLPDYTGNELSIIKLDITKDIELDCTFEDYLPCLDTLVSAYKERDQCKSTRYWKNKQCNLTIYDKTEECSHQSIPNNTIRIEYGMNKANKVKNKLGSNNISYLINNWDYLAEIFIEETSGLFKPTLNVNKYNDEGEYFKSFNKPMQEFILWKGVQHIAMDMTLSEFMSFMKNIGVSSTSLYRYKDKFIEMINTIPFGNNHATLYTEFRTKLLG